MKRYLLVMVMVMLNPLVSSTLWADTVCNVVQQVNSFGASNPHFVAAKVVTINQKYSPFNIEVDGLSLNEYILVPHDLQNTVEAGERTKTYLNVVSEYGSIKSFRMGNDWDTYELDGAFVFPYWERNRFSGVLAIRWDDSYVLHLDCEVL